MNDRMTITKFLYPSLLPQVLGCLWHINGKRAPVLDFYEVSKPLINAALRFCDFERRRWRN